MRRRTASSALLAPDQGRRREVRARHLDALVHREPGDRAQPLHDLGGALRPRAAVEAEQLRARAGRARRRLRREALDRRRRRAPDVAQLPEPARRIRVASGQQVVAERAEREQIGARVERLHLQRFGRDERRRADDVLGHAHAAIAPKSSSFARPSSVQRTLRAGHVAVQQPARVQDRERRRDVAQQRARLAPGQPAALARSAPSSSSIV